MTVLSRSRIPDWIYLLVESQGGTLQRTYIYHSYWHAWRRKEGTGGRLYKISTAAMEEMII